VGAVDSGFETLQVLGFKPKFLQILGQLVVHEKPHDNGFPQLRGEGRYADVEFPHPPLVADAAVMRNVGIGDIHIRHDFITRQQGLLESTGEEMLLMEDAIDAIVDAHQVIVGDDMDIAGTEYISFFNE